GFEGDGPGDLGGPLLEHGLIALHCVDAVLARAVGPVGEGDAGAFDGGLDLGRRGGLAEPVDFAGGGIDRLELGHGVQIGSQVFTRTSSPAFTLRASAVSRLRMTASPSTAARWRTARKS